jgi:hypothetical protein
LFQQALSFEKTPTLCHTVPAFEAFMASLRELQAQEHGAEFIIEQELTSLKNTVNLLLEPQPTCFLLVSSHLIILIHSNINKKQFSTLLQSLNGLLKTIQQNLQLKSNPSFFRQYVLLLLKPLSTKPYIA